LLKSYLLHTFTSGLCEIGMDGIAQKAYNKELCFLREPDGWFDSVDSFTKEQMLAGVDVSRVKLEDFDPAWLAPAEEEE